MANPPEVVSRTTHGLVDALFDTIDKLNAKQIDAEQARAISHTARTIVSVAHLELEYKKFAENSPTVDGLSSLTIEAPKPEAPKPQ
jgi:hypothetical protein